MRLRNSFKIYKPKYRFLNEFASFSRGNSLSIILTLFVKLRFEYRGERCIVVPSDSLIMFIMTFKFSKFKMGDKDEQQPFTFSSSFPFLGIKSTLYAPSSLTLLIDGSVSPFLIKKKSFLGSVHGLTEAVWFDDSMK